MEKEKEKKKQKELIFSNSKVCKRCKQSYDPNSNSSSSCRFHTSFFVCRRHDDQKRYSFIYQFKHPFLKLQFLFTILLNSLFFPSFFWKKWLIRVMLWPSCSCISVLGFWFNVMFCHLFSWISYLSCINGLPFCI